MLDLAVDAARKRATLGEISDAMETEFGRHTATIRSISGVYSAEASSDGGNTWTTGTTGVTDGVWSFNALNLNSGANEIRVKLTVSGEVKTTNGLTAVADDNDFATRATGTVIIPSSGTWTFGTNSDDGARLWVNNVQLVNNSLDRGAMLSLVESVSCLVVVDEADQFVKEDARPLIERYAEAPADGATVSRTVSLEASAITTKIEGIERIEFGAVERELALPHLPLVLLPLLLVTV